MMKFSLLATTALALAAAPAFAQESQGPGPVAASPTNAGSVESAERESATTAAPQEDSANAGDIVVTATRRNEALSNVPIAVSAVTADSLAKSGVTDIRQLNQLSPSLYVSSTSSEAGAGGAGVRGIRTVGDNPGLESSVATFIDGVYRNRSGVGLTDLGAVDRIEVLRGPQGTLFGRNASAGLISVITAKPKFQWGGEAQADYGNYDFYALRGGITGPLSEGIAFRLDGSYQHRDGFIKDVISGRRLNNRDRYLVRGQLLFEPSDDLSVRLIGDYAKRNEECCAATYIPTRNVTPGAGGTYLTSPNSIVAIERGLGATIIDDTFARRASVTPGQTLRGDVRDWGVSAEINYRLGGASLTSITAYRDWRFLRGQDADYNNLDILHRQDDGSNRQRFKTFTQELRLQGDAFGGKLDWLVGGYYAHEKLRFVDTLRYGTDYERYANCLLFASVLPAAVQPTPTGNCVNSAVLGGAIAQLSALPAAAPQRANLPLLQALAANPARPGFGSLAAALGQPGFTFNGVGASDDWRQTSRNYAFFTHNVFKITDRLSVTGGLRYTNERKTLDATLVDNNTLCRAITASPLTALRQLPCVIPSVPGGSFTQNNARKSEHKFTGTAVLSYKPTDQLLVYASYSKGYKAGGFNLDRASLDRYGRIAAADGSTLVNGTGAIGGTNATTPAAAAGNARTPDLQQLTFAPEAVDAFELGAKLNTGPFDLNVSAYLQKFDNFQLNTFNGLNFVVENVAGCSADLGTSNVDSSPTTGACTGKVKSGVVSKGVEIEAFLTLAPNFRVNQGFTLSDTKYRRNLTGTGGRPLSPYFFQLPGRRLSNSALYTVTGAATWTPEIGGGGLRGLAYVDYRYQSGLNTGSDLDLEKIQQGFVTVNARVGISGGEGRWGIEFWGQNVFNKNFYQVGFDSPLQGGSVPSNLPNGGTTRGVQQGLIPASNQVYSAFLGEPRTYGVTVRTKF